MFLALGRLTWNLIYLEDLSLAFVREVVPNPGLRGIESLLKEVIAAIAPHRQTKTLEESAIWLQSVREILPFRNAIMHGVPVSFYPDLESLRGRGVKPRQLIEHMRVKGRFTRIEMTTEYLGALDDQVTVLINQWTGRYVDFCTDFNNVRNTACVQPIE